MKRLLIFLFLLVAVGLVTGFYFKPDDPRTGDFLIGSALVLGFFVLMPLFIYYRWRNKDVRDYMLNKENIEKMRKYKEDKNL